MDDSKRLSRERDASYSGIYIKLNGFTEAWRFVWRKILKKNAFTTALRQFIQPQRRFEAIFVFTQTSIAVDASLGMEACSNQREP